MGISENVGNLDHIDHRRDHGGERIFDGLDRSSRTREAMMPWRGHSLLWANLIAGAISLFVVAPITWLALDREPAYVVNSLKVLPPTLPGGREAKLEWNFTVKRSGCDGSFYRVISDSVGVLRIYDRFDDTFTHLPIGSHQSLNTHTFFLPADMAPGLGKLTVYISSECTIFQHLWPVSTVVVAPFTILPYDGLTTTH
jgi:hypothetical protein